MPHTFQLYIEDTYVGEFPSNTQMRWPANVAYGCYLCGEVFARRLYNNGVSWQFLSSSCRICRAKGKASPWRPARFTKPDDFLKSTPYPLEILAWEFLFNTYNLESAHEYAYTTRDTGHSVLAAAS